MLNLKRNAVLGLNLYCGGGPSMAPASPSSPGVGGGGSAGSSAAPSPAEEPAVLLGGGAPNGCSEAPRSLIGCPPAPRALIGGAARWRPEEELDGCEPEAEDELRRASLALISRYLREAAGAVDSGPGGKNLFKGLLGAGGRAAEPGLERALDTLRRVGDGVLQKHQLAFQGEGPGPGAGAGLRWAEGLCRWPPATEGCCGGALHPGGVGSKGSWGRGLHVEGRGPHFWGILRGHEGAWSILRGGAGLRAHPWRGLQSPSAPLQVAPVLSGGWGMGCCKSSLPWCGAEVLRGHGLQPRGRSSAGHPYPGGVWRGRGSSPCYGGGLG